MASDIEKLEAGLNSLTPTRKTGVAAAIKKLAPSIEQKLSEGVTRKQIVDSLREQGVVTTENTLSFYLSKLRKGQTK